jgi:ankyrin repeat protein
VLVENGADVRARSNTGFTPLLFAVQHGSRENVRALLDAGANVNEPSSDGTTPLVAATVRGHWPLVGFLLDRGADPNAGNGGYTALHWAAGSWETELSGMSGSESFQRHAGRQTGKLELVKRLLAHGANPNARITKAPPRFGFSLFNLNLTGATPFLLAALAAEVDIMHVLLASGADPLLGTNRRTTPLMAAAGIGRVDNESHVAEALALEATRLTMQAGADVNAVNDEGETALHGAAYRGTTTVIQLLVDRGAKLTVTNKRGWTPFIIANGVRHPYGGGIVIHREAADLLRRLGGAGSEVAR